MSDTAIHLTPGTALRLGLTAIFVALTAAPARACDLDGLSHGYGPMAALFAGAHRYQSLNGVEEEPREPEAPVAPSPEAAAENAAADDAKRPTAPAPPAPRPSFVAWAKAKPKPDGVGEAPASWQRGARGSTDAAAAPPQHGEADQGEQREAPPRGGPVT